MILGISWGDIPGVGPLIGAAGGAVASAASAGFDAVAKAIVEAADQMFMTVISGWIKTNSASAVSPDTIQWLQGVGIRPLMLLVAVLSTVVCGTRLAWEAGFGGNGKGALEGLKALLRTIVIGAAGTTLILSLLEAGDAYSNWIIARSLADGQGLPDRLLADASLGSGIGFTLGILAIFASFVQMFLMVIRSALLVLLAGAWQATAAGSATETGAQSFKKVTGWIIAFLLYKPAAAICYAAGIRLMFAGNDNKPSLAGVITGLCILLMAILVLPALLRLVAPATAALGGASAGAALAAGAAVATGAVTMAATGGMLGGGGGGGGGSPKGSVGGDTGGGGGPAGAIAAVTSGLSQAAGDDATGRSPEAAGAGGGGPSGSPGGSGPSGGGGASGSTGSSGATGGSGGSGPSGSAGASPSGPPASSAGSSPSPSGSGSSSSPSGPSGSGSSSASPASGSGGSPSSSSKSGPSGSGSSKES